MVEFLLNFDNHIYRGSKPLRQTGYVPRCARMFARFTKDSHHEIRCSVHSFADSSHTDVLFIRP
jgi:hypothetical protein